jgi:hypothetical protein
VNLCYYELKEHKLWFDEEFSKLLDQRKQDKLQFLLDPREINGDNLTIKYVKPAGISGKKEGISERLNL